VGDRDAIAARALVITTYLGDAEAAMLETFYA